MRKDMPTFAGGEISDDLQARDDTAKFRTSLRRARNVLIKPAGGVYNRPGLLFAGEVHDEDRKNRTVPFQFSVSQGYALELGHNTLRVVSNGGYVLRKELEVVLISNAPFAAVTINGPHGYEDGWDVTFSGIEGMTEINGMKGRILNHDATSFGIDIDTSAFGIFTGSTGGVAGNAAGGTGGYPAPPPPPAPTDPPAPPPPFQDFEPLPPIYFGGGFGIIP